MTSTVARQRQRALAVVLLAQMMLIVDASIVNIALPAIREDLGFGESSLAWVIDAYLVCFGAFLLVAGRLGDLVGRRRVLVAGLVVFTAASLVCGLAWSPAALVAARAVQGLGAAFASAVILAMIAVEHPEPDERARAMSLYMLVSVSGGSVGLILGGVLTELASWHWIFFINVPLGVVAVLAAVRVLPERPGLGLGQGVDVLGGVLVTAAAMLGVAALVDAPHVGWLAPRTLALGVVAAGLLAAFWARQRRIATPILPPRILRIRSLVDSCIVRALLATGMFGSFFVGTLMLQRGLGLSTMQTGLAFMPQTLVVAALALGPARRLMARYGAAGVLIAGIVLCVVGLGLQATVDADTSYAPRLLVAFLLFGTGMGLSMPALVLVAMADVPPADAGVASALVNVSMYVASALGVAVVGALADDRAQALRDAGRAPVDALMGGYQLGLWVGAGLAAFALVMAVVLLRRPALAAHVAASAAGGD